ncbi:MAG TPA: MBL fold metallo-hydrolase [Desulfobacteraceae bacterium]|nr:MBL fold metallo-hydrolase [Desulfobacteraceae bacterium]
MDVLFIGVGEACDPKHGNTSIHVHASNGVSLLCDCGFSVPHTYFSFFEDPDQLDLVWISHFHGDHFFGMPLLLLRFWEMKRAKPLRIVGQRGVADKILAAMDLAYPNFRARLCYDVRFLEVEPGTVEEISGLSLRFIRTDHSQNNLGLLVDDGEKKLYYSGDGRPTNDVAGLIKNCDLAVHEAFRLDEEIHHHGSITGCLELADDAEIKKLAVVHLERNFRQKQVAEINALLAANPLLILPVSGDRISL